ncbi:MAG: hypothetical protein H0W40_10025 [Methylibium sp.]|uniref:hypothetical protein n=1 Tax=Methylibium sp. TaxID=2067992 RepID=UPI00183AC9FC|nr:hypothetical protein [Methylibium sp.]MBA3597701.1 hypothetical protein [Methylibium sp.]
MSHDAVYDMLRERDALHAVAVVDNDKPVALIYRSHFIASYARPYFKEPYGNKPCTQFALALLTTRPSCSQVCPFFRLPMSCRTTRSVRSIRRQLLSPDRQ